MAEAIPLRPFLRNAIDEITDRKAMGAGIEACRERRSDFSSDLEMELAGIAMVPEARRQFDNALTRYWIEASRRFPDLLDYSRREIVIGGGLHAAIYCANRVRMGFPRPYVLEQAAADKVGGAFAMSQSPVFRLNSRNRPGGVGLPDQDKALNYIPGALLQPSMVTSEEYPTNADMAWLVRLTLAQNAQVCTSTTVASIEPGVDGTALRIVTADGVRQFAGRVIDARGMGGDRDADLADGKRVLTFGQLMQRMGGMFPLRDMNQVAVIGAGDSGKCAVESMLGIAPGNSSAIGLDYVNRVDWYTNGTVSVSCSEFRNSQRGRYIRIAQFLEGNASNPTTRLRVISDGGYVSKLPDGVLVNDRTYDMAILCTGARQQPLESDPLSYFTVRQGRGSARETALAAQATPFEAYRIGPAANLEFSDTEFSAGVADIPANRVAMFRLAPRTAALAANLPGLE